MCSILVSRVLLLQIRLREAPLTNTVQREAAIQVKLNLHTDDSFHANLHKSILQIKITGSVLLAVISCSLKVARLLTTNLSSPSGVKPSSIRLVVDIILTFAYVLASGQLFRMSDKKLRVFFPLLLQSFPQRQLLQHIKKENILVLL